MRTQGGLYKIARSMSLMLLSGSLGGIAPAAFAQSAAPSGPGAAPLNSRSLR
jgi:hypothetical protein